MSGRNDVQRAHGSSPHARGTRLHRSDVLSSGPVHPRMRGERYAEDQEWQPRDGSSPHARGTLSAMRGPAAAARLIPACAGNAPFGGSPTGEKAVHPRMRGERTGAARGNVIAGGSSPHARGTPATEPVALRNNRFIPACAGNARGREGAVIGNTVHPRMRGERQARRRHNVPPDGSSPHARGTPVCAPSSWRSRRFIPACAGNAMSGRTDNGQHAVHPRMRGERNE